MFSKILHRLQLFGPGLIMAAAGIGAGDVVVASVTGINFGSTLLWAIALTAALKYVVTEALARWQLATGETLVRAWVTRLPRPVVGLLTMYLVFWTFMVGASLSSACGLAGASLSSALSVRQWGAVHAVIGFLLVAINRFDRFQRFMKGMIGLMAVCVLVCAGFARPGTGELLAGLMIPRLPSGGGGAAVLALLGGIGGSVTVVCYGYWLKAAGWGGPGKLAAVRADVRIAYLFTGLFGIALCVIAAGVKADAISGTSIVFSIAARLQAVAGTWARWIFMVGFWSTVFTAMLGVWQGVPHIFVELVDALGWRSQGHRARRIYLWALAFLALGPLPLLWFQQPVAVVITFSIVGAFFLPFLAGSLLFFNNQRQLVGDLANRRRDNYGLIICLVAFSIACIHQIIAKLV